MTEQTIRTQMLLGEGALARLRGSRVAVLGLGGVGSWCAEALARAGVGALTLVDEDTVSESNLNRQCCALHSTIGQSKAAVMAARVHDIDPTIAVDARTERYEAATRERFFNTEYDYIADCIDLVSCKVDLIRTAHARGIPIVSALGTGNKLDASRFELCDISQTSGCPFARVIRRELPEADIETLMVLDATTGQNGLIQAKQFLDTADLTGIVLTKLDGTAKGGIVFAIANDLQLPVKYVGVGEQIDDLLEFKPAEFVEALLS